MVHLNGVLTSVTFYMWPQYFAASFTARSGKVLRRNAVIMPLYSITTPLMLFVGLSAVLVLPGLSNGDLSLLMMVRKTFPAWFLGVVGGAGALTAMVPAAIQLLTGATLYAKNLFRPILAPGMTEQQVAKLAKIMVLVLTSGALSLPSTAQPVWFLCCCWDSPGWRSSFRGCTRPVFETCDHFRRFCGNGHRPLYCRVPDVDWARSLYGCECRLHRAMLQFCGDWSGEPAYYSARLRI